MTEAEFIKACHASGYASKTVAREWCRRNPMPEYSDEHFVEVYRFAEEPRRGQHRFGWRDMGNGNRNTISGVNRGLAGDSRIEQDC